MSILDPVSIIRTAGVIGILAIIFAESGLFVGIVLPGDTLLFTTGFLESQHILTMNIYLLGVLIFIASVLGNNLGYYLGKKFGPKVFARDNSIFLHKENMVRARRFYKRHGGKTVLLSRFIPTVRSFAPLIAGIADMNYLRFMIFNVIGGAIWITVIVALGYYLGARLHQSIDHYVLPIIVLVIISGWIPTIIHFAKDKKGRELLIEKLRTMKVLKRKPKGL